MLSVRVARKSRGWTQEHLAGVSGVSYRTIQRVEAGEVQPSPETLMALSDALGVRLGKQPHLVPTCHPELDDLLCLLQSTLERISHFALTHPEDTAIGSRVNMEWKFEEPPPEGITYLSWEHLNTTVFSARSREGQTFGPVCHLYLDIAPRGNVEVQPGHEKCRTALDYGFSIGNLPCAECRP